MSLMEIKLPITCGALAWSLPLLNTFTHDYFNFVYI